MFRAFPGSFVVDWGFQISEALWVRNVGVLVSVPHYDRQRLCIYTNLPGRHVTSLYVGVPLASLQFLYPFCALMMTSNSIVKVPGTGVARWRFHVVKRLFGRESTYRAVDVQ